jgi:hypothetical protein
MSTNRCRVNYNERMAFFRDINAPDTSWRPSNEDPIPVVFGRYPFTAFLYRWFAGRPLDGHARSNATWREPPTFFFTRTRGKVEREEGMEEDQWRALVKKTAPWPAAWHMLPRWRQCAYTRVLPTGFVASFPLVAWLGGMDALGAYAHFYWVAVLLPLFHFLAWAVTLWA